jgi:hypothetical protein
MSAVNITMVHVHFPAYAMVFGTLMDESFIGVGLSALQHRPCMVRNRTCVSKVSVDDDLGEWVP